jgi:hypothetical protein
MTLYWSTKEVSSTDCRRRVASDGCQGTRDFPLDTHPSTLVSFRIWNFGSGSHVHRCRFIALDNIAVKMTIRPGVD